MAFSVVAGVPLLAHAALRLPARRWSVPALGGAGRLRSACVSLVVVSSKYVVVVVVRTYLIQVFCLAIIFTDILCWQACSQLVGMDTMELWLL